MLPAEENPSRKRVKTFHAALEDPSSASAEQLPSINAAASSSFGGHLSASSASSSASFDRCFVHTYDFGGVSSSAPSLSVCALERRSSSSAQLGSFVWPSALMLAAYVQQQMREEIRGRTVLELGAGRSVSGIVCALIGAQRVLLTDADTAVLKDAELTARLNGLSSSQVQVQQLAWGDFTPSSAALVGRVSLLLGADVLYEPSDFDPLLATVAYFDVPLLTVYQHRGEGMRRSVNGCAGRERPLSSAQLSSVQFS